MTLGAVSPRYAGTASSTTSRSVVALAVTSLPEFVVAIGLIILFSTGHRICCPPSPSAAGHLRVGQPELLILPVATLVIVIVPYIFRMMRAAMIEALESDYVEMARLKGVPEWQVVLGHALPNAIAPTIQVIGLNFLYLAGRHSSGRVRVQLPRHRPGAGVRGRRPGYSRIQFIVVILAAFYVVMNIADRRHRAAGDATAQDREVAMAVPSSPGYHRAAPAPASAPAGTSGSGVPAMVGCAHAAARVGLGAGLVRRPGRRHRPGGRPVLADALQTFPFAKPSGRFLLGGDFLGRDVLSRVLNGGWVLLLMAAAATAFGIVAGTAAGDRRPRTCAEGPTA